MSVTINQEQLYALLKAMWIFAVFAVIAGCFLYNLLGVTFRYTLDYLEVRRRLDLRRKNLAKRTDSK